MVREVSEACHRHGLRFSVYYSPWDKQEPYGKPEYNDVMVAELTELLTNYGLVDIVWFDGAGQDPRVSGVKMDFDWARIHKTIRTLQPQAVISGVGPDIRWIGNEGSRGRETEWSVQGIHRPQKDFAGFRCGVTSQAPQLGHIKQLIESRPIQLAWFPARGGLPIHTKWFWVRERRTRSLEYLVTSYYQTVGSNATVMYNLSPDPQGQVPKDDMALMHAFGQWRRQLWSTDHANGAVAVADKTREEGHHPNYLLDDDIHSGWVAPKGQEDGTVTMNLPVAKTFDGICPF